MNSITGAKLVVAVDFSQWNYVISSICAINVLKLTVCMCGF